MASLAEVLQHDRYIGRKRMLRLLGGAVRIFDASGRLLLYVDQKAFKLREEIRVFADEGKSAELLLIKARQIIDFSATYDVIESASGRGLGSLRRRGIRSLVQDAWELCDPSDAVVATILEDPIALALLRRLVLDLIPQRYRLCCGERAVGTLRRNWNPFTSTLTVDLRSDTERVVNRPLVLAVVILLLLIEGKQD